MNCYQNDARITINDVSFCGKSDISDVMTIFQDAVTKHTHYLGADAPMVYKKLNAKWVITRIRFEADGVLSMDDKYTVKTWPLKAKPLRFGRSFVIEKEDKRIIKAYSEWCLLDADTDAVIRTDRLDMPIKEYLTDTAVDNKFSMARGDFCDSDIVYKRTMRQSDIDLNRHVNNVSYIRLALDCFSSDELENMNISSFEMYYIAQCYEGDTLTLYRKDGCIEARNGDKPIFRCTYNL